MVRRVWDGVRRGFVEGKVKGVRERGLRCAMGKIQSQGGVEGYVRTDMYTNGERAAKIDDTLLLTVGQ